MSNVIDFRTDKPIQLVKGNALTVGNDQPTRFRAGAVGFYAPNKLLILELSDSHIPRLIEAGFVPGLIR